MAGQVYGADVAELRSLSARLLRSAADLDRIANLLTHQITGTTAWVGPNAQKFRGEWSGSHRRALASAGRSLRDSSAAVRRNADEQEKTSAADSSSGGPAGAGGGSGAGSHRGARPDLFGNAFKQAGWAKLLTPAGVATLAVGLLPGALRLLHVKEFRLGDADNHILISSDGTVSVKAEVIKTELTVNQNDSSFKAQFAGLGLEHTKEGAWGVLATPGVHVGPLNLSAGLEVTYNPNTGVIAPSGEYQVGVDHLIGTDGSIRKELNVSTGDVDTQVSLGGEVFGARHEVQAAEHNDQFVSTSTTDSLTAGPVTVSQTHSQSLTPDGSFIDREGTTETVSKSIGFDSTYFAVKGDPLSASHSNISTTSTTADGTPTTSNVSTNSAGW